MKKKILYLCDVPFDSVGGAQKSMQLVVNGLSDEFEIKVLTPKLVHKAESDIFLELQNWNSFILKKNGFFNSLKIIFEISHAIKIYKPDIVHVQMPSTMITIVLLKLMKRISSKTKVFYTDRGVYKKYGKLTRYFILIGIKFGVFSKIVCTTKNNKESYKKFKPKDLLYIPNSTGIDFEKSYSRRNNETISNIGFSGRWNYDKNWGLVKKIILKLSTYDNYHFILCIGVDNEHKREVIDFFKKIEDEIEGTIELHINVSTKMMIQQYQNMDLFILTSRKESFGRTAIEAMVLDTVVIGTNVDGLKEVIGYDDFVYESDDLEDFSKLFVELNKKIKTNNDLKSIKQMFLERYYENYSIKKNLDLHKKMYS